MDYKDTVMNEKEMGQIETNWLGDITDKQIDAGTCPNILMAVAKAQAEISFKAGIKEVLDAIHYEPNKYVFYVWPITWQTKIKEWGV